MSHWGSVGVIARSMALNGVSSELSGDKWGSAGAYWGSVEPSGVQCAMYIHPFVNLQ